MNDPPQPIVMPYAGPPDFKPPRESVGGAYAMMTGVITCSTFAAQWAVTGGDPLNGSLNSNWGILLNCFSCFSVPLGLFGFACGLFAISHDRPIPRYAILGVLLNLPAVAVVAFPFFHAIWGR